MLTRTVLELNTLGDSASRQAYRAALVAISTPRIATKLSEDSRRRLERNPLRILDSKDEGDKRDQRRSAGFRRSISRPRRASSSPRCAPG